MSLNPFLAGILIGLGIALIVRVLVGLAAVDREHDELTADDSDDLHA